MEDTEPVAHMIDIEPVLVLNCSAGEIKMCAIVSLLSWFCVFLALFFIFGIDLLKIILVPLLSLLFASVTTYYSARYIGKQKRGKPHLYYMHKFEMNYISIFRKPSYMSHKGYFCIGRSPKPGVRVNVKPK